MRRWIFAIFLITGCATQAKQTSLPATKLGVAEKPKPAADQISTEAESFEDRLRTRANQALSSVGATADQKTKIDIFSKPSL